MTTIQDVARRAGVAPITVSRVVNQRGYYSRAIQQRVEEAIAELGYVPNRVASSLRSKRTNLLALVITDIANPFFTLIARGVEDAANQAGYSVLYCNTDESSRKEANYLQILLENQAAGVLLVPAGGDAAPVEMLLRNETPVVVLDRRMRDLPVDVVVSDSVAGAVLLMRHLIALGHRRIALLDGPEGISTADERLQGYHQALDEAEVPRFERLVLRGRYTQASGEEMALQALELVPRPTALFAANNFIAIGALRMLRARALRVPQDIALVGFDDLPPALVTFPFLTVAVQPAYEMGRRAAELLLQRLRGEAPAEPQEIVLPVELVVRESSGEEEIFHP